MEIHKYNTVHKQMQGQKPNDSLIEKKLWQNPTSFHDKSSEEARDRRNILQHNKGYIWQT
jgi:hypothetical protein